MSSPVISPFDADLLLQAQELVHVGTWEWDVATDTVRWSDELCRLFGVVPGTIEIRLSTYLERVHPDDRDRVAGIIAQSMEGDAGFEFDARVIRADDGATRVHYARGSIIRHPNGSVRQMVGACIDITDRAQAQQRLRESEERFRSVFEQSAVGMTLTDSERRYVYVNDAFARYLGYERLELIGKRVVDVTHPDDAATVSDTARILTETEASVTVEKRYVRKNGAVVWARATVTPLRDQGSDDVHVALVEDITEWKTAAHALREQTELLGSILDHLPVMVSMFAEEATLLYVNREWERLFGWTFEEARTLDVFAAVYPDAAEAERALSVVRDAKAQWIDFEPRARDGHVIQSSWACIRLSDGRLLTIGQDMRERRAMQQQLLQSQKMEALGQLAGGVAHDFNNLLTIISGCASFVLEDVPANAPVRSDLQEIGRACDRAAALTRQLLAFSRRQMLKQELVNVNESVDALSKTLKRLIGENIELVVLPRATAPFIQADAFQLEQALLNLVVNARDAIADTGSITIETCDAPSSGSSSPGEVMIVVADTGCGMDAATREHIFEPFFTTKAPGKGTGLGLATVHGIVTQSGGTIAVQTELGIGTTFTIRLPRAAGLSNSSGAPVPTGAPRADKSPAAGGTILLVEDEAALRMVARRVLAAQGYDVLEARHGADAARISASHSGRIDLLLTDVVMPELGGLELARLVRQQRPGTPVLYVSGYTDDELLRQGIMESGAALLRKPFTGPELAAAVRGLLPPHRNAA